MTIVSNHLVVEEKITASLQAANREPSNVTCVVVTKQRTLEEVEQLYDLGYRHFAENRPEGLKEKQAHFTQSDINWHFVGSLQTRKVKQVINDIDFFHALDRLSLAKEIEKRAEEVVSCFVQVNVSGEASKHGVSPDNLLTFIESLEEFSKVKVVGLMTMAPIEASKEALKEYFEHLKALQVNVMEKGYSHAPCQETSMGMSNDFELAIQAGASVIRVGTAFFE